MTAATDKDTAALMAVRGLDVAVGGRTLVSKLDFSLRDG